MLSICYHFSFAASEHACTLKAFSLRRDGGFIYLLFRRKHGMHCISPLLPLRKQQPNSAHPFAVLVAVFGGYRCAVRKGDITPLPASRNKRYNTLDPASKIVCQRQAHLALLWKPPGYRQHHFSAGDRNAFCRYSFSPYATKMQNRFLWQRWKMKKDA